MNRSIAIIGAGIGGLTAAIAFEKLGHTVTIYEASPAIRPVGAGLGLGGNAVGALKVLGIAEAVIAQGNLFQNFPILDQDGKVIYNVNSEKIKSRFSIENFTIHRAALHAVLLEQIMHSEILLNKRLINLEATEKGYKLYFEDNSAAMADIVIGADGVHSKTRNFVNPTSKVRYAGYVCWRAVINNPGGIEMGFETWGENGRFGAVPLSDNQVYWFLCINARTPHQYKQLKKQDLSRIFKHYHAPIPELIAATPDEALIYNPIIDLEPQKHFAKERVLLIGDAAHATTPNLGQGACQAIEDVATLYQILQREQNIENAFKIFERKRRKRTHFIVNTSYRVGKVAQLENPLLCSLRNALFRALPTKISNKQLEKVVYEVDYDIP